MIPHRLFAGLGLFVFAFVALSAGTARAGLGECGQPSTDGPAPLATDALQVLRAAVNIVGCDLCVCDVDTTGDVRATDALLVLRAAVGSGETLDCVACPVSVTIGPEGGSIVLDDGGAVLEIPPGAVDVNTEFTFGGLAPSLLEAPLELLGAEDAYFILPAGLVLDPSPVVTVVVEQAEVQRGPAIEFQSYTPSVGATSSGGPDPSIDIMLGMRFRADSSARTMILQGELRRTGDLAIRSLNGAGPDQAFNLNADFISLQEFATPTDRRVSATCGAQLMLSGTIPVDDAASDPGIKDDNSATLMLTGVCSDEVTFSNECTAPGGTSRWVAQFFVPTAIINALVEGGLVTSGPKINAQSLLAEIGYPVKCDAPAVLTTVTYGLSIGGPEGINRIGLPFAGETGSGFFDNDLYVVAGADGGEVFFPEDAGAGDVSRIFDFRNSYNPARRVEAIGLIDISPQFRGPDPVGQDVYFEVSSAGWTLFDYDPVYDEFSGFATVGGGAANHTDARPYANDSRTGGAIFVNFQDNEVLRLEFSSEARAASLTIETRINSTALAATAGNVISAFGQESGGLVVGVTVGDEADTPGDIFTFSGGVASTPVTIVGQAGISPRRVRCTDLALGGACMVTSFADDTISVFTVSALGVVGTISVSAVAEEPVGGDIVRLEAPGRTSAAVYRVVTTGFVDDTFVITTLDESGAVLGTDVFDAPGDCIAPGHATWMDEDSFIASCNGSDNVVVADLP